MVKIYEESNYDSTSETQKHIDKVIINANRFISKLQKQVEKHDSSKLKEPEKAYFDEATPKLKNLEYGSDEYKKSLEDIKPALDHHYANNSHHPDHYKNGINGMSLIDLVEMIADWKAACSRNKDSNIEKSLEINKEKFKINDQLYDILKNTIEKDF
jgi:hypothetical protein